MMVVDKLITILYKMFWVELRCRAFCPTLLKNELETIPYLYNRKKWTGWDLNPRPQLGCSFSKAVLYLTSKGQPQSGFGVTQNDSGPFEGAF
jgi:hypothetical protein